MNCPVCNRSNAVVLSICPSCGAMIKDSVREDLDGKISAAAKISKREVNINTMSEKPLSSAQTAAPEKSAAVSVSNTSAINSKPTSQTLVEFHSKNSTLPEWRLQLQNVVRQRQEIGKTETAAIGNLAGATSSPPRAKLVTSGANALKAETVTETEPALHSNPDVARALQRIKDSRQKFLVDDVNPQAAEPAIAATKTNKNYPFYIASKTSEAEIRPAEPNAPVNVFAKPKLASSLRTAGEKLDTNKLPPLPKPANISTSFTAHSVASETLETKLETKIETKSEDAPQSEIKIVKTEAVVETVIVETTVEEIEEYDENAPFAMRFNAGLFDLIIGSFVSSLLLSPFMMMSGNWLSWSGLFAFLATCSIVMFIYLTTAIGLYGKTFGMNLFSLELVDIEGEDYPTFHQAAVSSSVYLLSLAFGGLGFLTVPFNEEKRAVHDIVSGTVVVRED